MSGPAYTQYANLPPGWEMRFNTQYQRYFYINHNTKKTQWEPPQWETADSTTHQSASTLLNQPNQESTSTRLDNQQVEIPLHSLDANGHVQINEHETETIIDKEEMLNQLKAQFPSCKGFIVKNVLQNKRYNMGDAASELVLRGYRKIIPPPNGLQTLKYAFPHVDKSLVYSIWMAANQDRSKAEARLIQLGYFPFINRANTGNRGSYHNSSNTSPHRHQQRSHGGGSREHSPHSRNAANLSPHHSSSPNRSPRQLSPKTSLSPSKSSSPRRSPSPSAQLAAASGPSEAEKERLIEKLVSQFPQQPRTVIAAALDVCSYNEVQTTAVLQASESDDRPQQRTTSATSSPVHQQQDDKHSHPKPSNSKAGASYEPVAFNEKPNGSTSSSTSSVRDAISCKSPVDEDSPERISNMPSVINDYPSKLPTSQARAKQVTSKCDTVVTSEKQVYMSPYRMQNSGPNTSLRLGPMDKNLLPSYVGVKGPNPENFRGPDSNLVKGSVKARGADPLNRCRPLNSVQNQDPVLVTKLMTTNSKDLPKAMIFWTALMHYFPTMISQVLFVSRPNKMENQNPKRNLQMEIHFHSKNSLHILVLRIAVIMVLHMTYLILYRITTSETHLETAMSWIWTFQIAF
ncbi:mucin-5AC isoform X2 [Octopus vulgaris]|uniref:Mucin-5AC isoform X2 n=1 Tax=Octopus vulgaris TaxID=6645 RepID=A0AA36EYB1_OCTVU|nr:mucin-5AC isoform X2 [Octopus vulgaris]